MVADGRRKNYCRRCGHIWTTRVEHPEHCPKCKSKLWDCGNMLWSCGSCGNLREFRCDRPVPNECPRCSSSSWRCATSPYACGCGYAAHFMSDRDAVCPICRVRMARSDGRIIDRGNGRSSRAGKGMADADPVSAEILERFGRGQNALTISRETGVSFETVMKVLTG
ncbi:MAG: hypothetical protein MJZ21_00145 [archaeon]|nr:hypothetical protein [archaeon]